MKNVFLILTCNNTIKKTCVRYFSENKKWIEYLSSQRDAQLAQDYLESFIVAVQDLEGVSIDQKSLNAIQASIGSSQ